MFSNIGSSILHFIETNAYWICLFVGLGGLVAYIAGFKKGGKVCIFCIFVYWIIAAICSVR